MKTFGGIATSAASARRREPLEAARRRSYIVERQLTVNAGTVLVLVALEAALFAQLPYALLASAGVPIPLVVPEFAHLCGAAGAMLSVLQARRMPRWQLIAQFLVGSALYVYMSRAVH